MLKIVSTFLALLVWMQVYSQNNIKNWDEELRKKTKGNLKFIRKGNLRTGFGTSYFKADKTVFSVEKRELFRTKRQYDSSLSFSANFRNDTLFRIVIHRYAFKEKNGRVIMYLDGDKILDKEIIGKVYIPEISQLREKAFQLLAEAKVLIAAK